MVESVVYKVRSNIATSSAGETVNHSKVTLLYALGRDSEELLGAVGNIILRVGSGLVVLICIDTENREVAGMTRPHPVIGIATKLTN